MPRSLSGSPARKRQRLSSPTYDDQVEDLTQEDLAAFDAIEAQLSQAHSLKTGKLSGESSRPQTPLLAAVAPSLKGSNLRDDPDNPFRDDTKSAKSSEKSNTSIAFASVSTLSKSTEGRGRSPSPECPPAERNYDDWFQSTSSLPNPGFSTPQMPAKTAEVMFGFTTASKKSKIILPSKKALEIAAAKREGWERGYVPPVDPEGEISLSAAAPLDTRSEEDLLSSYTPPMQSPMKAASKTTSTINEGFSTSSVAGFSRPSLHTSPATPHNPHRPKPFKTPFLKQPHTASNVSISSPLNPQRSNTSFGFVSAASHPHPLAASPMNISTVMPNVTSNFTTPFLKNNASSGRTTPAPFKTPFRSGFKPPLLTPGNARSPQIQRNVVNNYPTTKTISQKIITRKQFFCLTSPTKRQTLASSGLRPQQYTSRELEGMGIDSALLSQVTPENARYYNFSTTESTPPPASSASKVSLGPKEALRDLLRRGCTLATQPWIDNHWSLILWKLAGMVTLDPIRETKPGEARWCWPEVIRQLLYRYERELNGGSRPPLRRIANQDAPAAFPMVLCISNIFWTSGGVTEDGVQIESHPELELTDGWYRLRAQLDLPLARAVKRGIIRIGRKIGFAGARLSTEKKDPTEILEAYNSTHLVLSGNSSHLMPWHTKLGFTEGPCISTLHSLTCDGGVVTALDFVITKLYPIAFIEFIEGEDGSKDRVGPRNEAEEMEVNEKWHNRCEMEASKLRAEYEKKFSRYAGYADRLEKKAGVMLQHAKESDGYAPAQIDSMYDELEYPDTAAKVIARANSYEAAWLALQIHRQNEKEREQIGEEIEKELRTICPPRNVKSFRMLIIQDARTSRRPANRTAQLTVWDVLSLSSDEDSKAGGFEVGQRFMATNLLPTHQSAWMDCAPGSEVYLCTRRDTRWTRIKATA